MFIKILASTLFLLVSTNACATFIGSILNAEFINPSPLCGTGSTVCTIDNNLANGATSITWGTALSGTQSQLIFTPVSLSAETRFTNFPYGDLFFKNGEIAINPDTGINQVHLLLNISAITDTSNNNSVFVPPSTLDITLQTITTPNSPDPLNPDIVNITEYLFNDILKSTLILKYNPNDELEPAFNSFLVKEGLDTSAKITGRFGSLDVAGFSDIANPEAGFLTFSVPEPDTFSLLCTGFLGLILKSNLRIRRKQLI